MIIEYGVMVEMIGIKDIVHIGFVHLVANRIVQQMFLLDTMEWMVLMLMLHGLAFVLLYGYYIRLNIGEHSATWVTYE